MTINENVTYTTHSNKQFIYFITGCKGTVQSSQLLSASFAIVVSWQDVCYYFILEDAYNFLILTPVIICRLMVIQNWLTYVSFTFKYFYY